MALAGGVGLDGERLRQLDEGPRARGAAELLDGGAARYRARAEAPSNDGKSKWTSSWP
jgi:hypothetical protein